MSRNTGSQRRRKALAAELARATAHLEKLQARDQAAVATGGRRVDRRLIGAARILRDGVERELRRAQGKEDRNTGADPTAPPPKRTAPGCGRASRGGATDRGSLGSEAQNYPTKGGPARERSR